MKTHIDEGAAVRRAIEERGFYYCSDMSSERFEFYDVSTSKLYSVAHAADGVDDWQAPTTFAQPVEVQMMCDWGSFESWQFTSVREFLTWWEEA